MKLLRLDFPQWEKVVCSMGHQGATRAQDNPSGHYLNLLVYLHRVHKKKYRLDMREGIALANHQRRFTEPQLILQPCQVPVSVEHSQIVLVDLALSGQEQWLDIRLPRTDQSLRLPTFPVSKNLPQAIYEIFQNLPILQMVKTSRLPPQLLLSQAYTADDN